MESLKLQNILNPNSQGLFKGCLRVVLGHIVILDVSSS